MPRVLQGRKPHMQCPGCFISQRAKERNHLSHSHSQLQWETIMASLEGFFLFPRKSQRDDVGFLLAQFLSQLTEFKASRWPQRCPQPVKAECLRRFMVIVESGGRPDLSWVNSWWTEPETLRRTSLSPRKSHTDRAWVLLGQQQTFAGVGLD